MGGWSNDQESISTANQGPPDGPREFDYIFQLETPFHYNPSAGNLIMEMRWTGLSQDGNNGHKGDFVLDTSTAAQFLYKEGDSLATTAEYNLGGDVWQFTFVPEPSTLLLGAMAVMGMVIRRRSLR